VGYIVGLLIAGIFVGALGRLVHPGKDPMPWWLTLGIGVVATLAAGILIGGFLGFVLAVIVAAVLVGFVGRYRPAR
jgi:hypothetical protein